MSDSTRTNVNLWAGSILSDPYAQKMLKGDFTPEYLSDPEFQEALKRGYEDGSLFLWLCHLDPGLIRFNLTDPSKFPNGIDFWFFIHKPKYKTLKTKCEISYELMTRAQGIIYISGQKIAYRYAKNFLVLYKCKDDDGEIVCPFSGEKVWAYIQLRDLPKALYQCMLIKNGESFELVDLNENNHLNLEESLSKYIRRTIDVQSDGRVIVDKFWSLPEKNALALLEVNDDAQKFLEALLEQNPDLNKSNITETLMTSLENHSQYQGSTLFDYLVLSKNGKSILEMLLQYNHRLCMAISSNKLMGVLKGDTEHQSTQLLHYLASSVVGRMMLRWIFHYNPDSILDLSPENLIAGSLSDSSSYESEAKAGKEMHTGHSVIGLLGSDGTLRHFLSHHDASVCLKLAHMINIGVLQSLPENNNKKSLFYLWCRNREDIKMMLWLFSKEVNEDLGKHITLDMLNEAHSNDGHTWLMNFTTFENLCSMIEGHRLLALLITINPNLLVGYELSSTHLGYLLYTTEGHKVLAQINQGRESCSLYCGYCCTLFKTRLPYGFVGQREDEYQYGGNVAMSLQPSDSTC